MFQPLGFSIGNELSPMRSGIRTAGDVVATLLRRESDGTVTVLSIGNTYTPKLTRQSDGTVTVEAA